MFQCVALILLALIPLGAASPGDVDPVQWEFNKAWYTYYTHKLGCPLVEDTARLIKIPEDCTQPSVIDYTEFRKARKLAAKVFGFKE